jgi:hypothetical protein
VRACFFTAVMVLVLPLLSGCNTVSEGDYKASQAFLAENRPAKRLVTQECANDLRFSAIEKRELSALLNVPESKVTAVACRRFVNAIANGRMTYSDYVKMNSSGGDNSKLIRILLGR